MNSREVVAICFTAVETGDVLALHIDPMSGINHELGSKLAVECGRELSRVTSSMSDKRTARKIDLAGSGVLGAEGKKKNQSGSQSGGSGAQGGAANDGQSTSDDPRKRMVSAGEVLSVVLGASRFRAMCQVIEKSFTCCVIGHCASTPGLSASVLEALVGACRVLKVANVEYVHRSLSLSLVCEEVIHHCATGGLDPATVAEWVNAVQVRSHFDPVESAEMCLCSFDDGLAAGAKKAKGKKAKQRMYEQDVERLQNQLWQGQRPELLLRDASFAIADDGIPDCQPVRKGTLAATHKDDVDAMAMTQGSETSTPGRAGELRLKAGAPTIAAGVEEVINTAATTLASGASKLLPSSHKRTSSSSALPSSLSRRSKVSAILDFEAPSSSPLVTSHGSPTTAAASNTNTVNSDVSTPTAIEHPDEPHPAHDVSASDDDSNDTISSDGNLSDREERKKDRRLKKKMAQAEAVAAEERKKKLAALDDLFGGTASPVPAAGSTDPTPPPLTSPPDVHEGHIDPFAPIPLAVQPAQPLAALPGMPVAEKQEEEESHPNSEAKGDVDSPAEIQAESSLSPSPAPARKAASTSNALDDIFSSVSATPSMSPSQSAAPALTSTSQSPQPAAATAFDPFGAGEPAPVTTTTSNGAATSPPLLPPVECSIKCTETVQLKSNKNGDGQAAADVVGEVQLTFALAAATKKASPVDDAFFAGEIGDDFGGGNATGEKEPMTVYLRPVMESDESVASSDKFPNGVTYAGVQNVSLTLEGPVASVALHPDLANGATASKAQPTSSIDDTFALKVEVITVLTSKASDPSIQQKVVQAENWVRCDEEKPATLLMYKIDPSKFKIDRVPVQCKTQWLRQGTTHQVKAMVVGNPEYIFKRDASPSTLQVTLPLKPALDKTHRDGSATERAIFGELADHLDSVQAAPSFNAPSSVDNSAFPPASWTHPIPPNSDESIRLMLAARFSYAESGGALCDQIAPTQEVVRIQFAIFSANKRDGKSIGGVSAKATTSNGASGSVDCVVSYHGKSGDRYDFYR